MSLELKIIFLIVVGVILAVTLPNMLNARQRQKQKRTMGDMRTVATAIESYSIDNNTYSTATDLDAFAPYLEPKYIKKLPRKDGWGHALEIDARTSEYSIRSLGRDGKRDDEGGITGTIAPNGGTTNFNADVIFSTGSFVQFPDGSMT